MEVQYLLYNPTQTHFHTRFCLALMSVLQVTVLHVSCLLCQHILKTFLLNKL